MLNVRWLATAALTAACLTSIPPSTALSPVLPGASATLSQSPLKTAQESAQKSAQKSEPEGHLTQVGEEEAEVSAVGYGGQGFAPRDVVTHPGASYIKVHFESLKLAPGDYVTVSDPERIEVYKYHGDPTQGAARRGDSLYTQHDGPGFAAMSVEGDTAIVTLHTTKQRRGNRSLQTQGYGAQIDRIWRGLNHRELVSVNSICGEDGRRDAVCYRESHPTEYARSQAVARQLTEGMFACTGWRVGNTNRVLTNNHCVSTVKKAAATELQFGYECKTCGGNDAGTPKVKVTVNELIKTSARSGGLDYTLMSLNNFDSVKEFGTLYLDPREPVQDERIYMPGHGSFAPKQIGMFEDKQGGSPCKVDKPKFFDNDMGYNCDTTGGNSGGPVLAASSNKVIALHHSSGCPSNENSGTRIIFVYNEIRDLIDNNDGTPNRDFSVSLSPAAGETDPGGSVSSTVTTKTTAGKSQSLALTATGVPAGAKATFAPASVTSGETSTLSIATSSTVAAGKYVITVSAAGESGTRTTTYSLSINGAPDPDDDFSVALSPSSGSTDVGGSVSSTVTTATTSGAPQALALTVAGLPTGAAATFTPPSINSGDTSVLKIATGNASAGTYSLTVSAAGESATKTATYTLTIKSGTPPPVCANYPYNGTGQLAKGGTAYQPDGIYYYAFRSGTHSACLSAPVGAGFTLGLQHYTGGSWKIVAEAGSNGQLSYAGAPGAYRYLITAVSGAGNYTLGYSKP